MNPIPASPSSLVQVWSPDDAADTLRDALGQSAYAHRGSANTDPHYTTSAKRVGA